MPRDMEVRPVHIPAPSQACHFPAKLKVSFRLGALTTPLTPLFNVGAATGGGQPSIIPLARDCTSTLKRGVTGAGVKNDVPKTYFSFAGS